MHTRTITGLFCVAVSIARIQGASAQTNTWECDYKTWSDEVGLHKVRSPFRITFLIDGALNKAYAVGDTGSSGVSLVANAAGGFSLVETTSSGNVMTTVITSSGKSVHSRGSIILGELVPSQYYGSCKKK